MGQEFISLFQLETRRLLWFIGLTFAVILAFQYIQLPYANFLLSPFPTIKTPTSQTTSFHTADPPSSNSQISHNDQHALNIQRESNKSLGSDESDKSSIVDGIKNLDNGSVTAEVGMNNLTSNSGEEKNITLIVEHKSANSSIADDSPSSSPSPTIVISNFTTPPPELPKDSMKNQSLGPPLNIVTQNSSILKDDLTSSIKNSSINGVPDKNKNSPTRIPQVLSISDMNKLLLQSRASYSSMRPRWFSAVDQELVQARSEIENAPIVENDPSLYAPLYRNVSMFKRSYDIMEERLKVYVYREGEKPIMHSPFLRGIYASEGWFMKLMEANRRFVTKDPKKAHLFYLPFSSRMLEETLYVQDSHNHNNLRQYLNNYVDMIASKHPFWNRTGGSDHFLVACHDWAPTETRQKMAKCIRALCNSDVKEGFVFGKDVSLAETYIRNLQNPARDMGGKRASKRSTLAFFAGNMHGYVRPILLQHWENKDPDMKIFGKLPKSKGDRNYIQYMKSSKYCICAKGYEVNSPRVVEAILYECVPVIISDNFVPPFFEVLDWESFAVFIMEKDIPNLKTILLSISAKRYVQMQMRVRKVQQHFLWHTKAVKYDIFHMILHSIWYNRLFNARLGIV